MAKLIKVQISDDVNPNLVSDGQGGYFLDLSKAGGSIIVPPIIIPPIVPPTVSGQEYWLPWPPQGQIQIPTSPYPGLESLASALQNWSDGTIGFKVPDDLKQFDNKTKFGQFRIVPGPRGDLPSGVLTVDGGNPLVFNSEFPDFGYSVDNPGSQAFNTTRGSVVRMRLTGNGSYVLVFSTPTR